MPDDWRYPEDHLALVRKGVVQDRFHLSEMIYGETLRGGSKLTSADCEAIDWAIHEVGGMTVLLTCDESIVRARHASSGRSEDFSLGNILQVRDQFEWVGKHMTLSVVEVAMWFKDGAEDVDQVATEIIHRWHERLEVAATS